MNEWMNDSLPLFASMIGMNFEWLIKTPTESFLIPIPGFVVFLEILIDGSTSLFCFQHIAHFKVASTNFDAFKGFHQIQEMD